MKDTISLRYHRELNAALRARGLGPATPVQAARCWRARFTAGEAAAVLAMG